MESNWKVKIGISRTVLCGMLIMSLILSSYSKQEDSLKVLAVENKGLIDVWDAVQLAASYGYDMVELDVQESKDHHPLVFHDGNMKHACGIDKKISDFTLEELTTIGFLESDETITSLDSMLKLCRLLDLGVMFDIKQGERSEGYFKRIRDLIDQHGLERSCMTLSDTQVQDQLRGKVLLTIPEKWPIELIEVVQENGGLVIPALNTFRYSEEKHRSEARYDAERLLKAGVDGFQIDCVYQDYFGRPKVVE